MKSQKKYIMLLSTVLMLSTDAKCDICENAKAQVDTCKKELIRLETRQENLSQQKEELLEELMDIDTFTEKLTSCKGDIRRIASKNRKLKTAITDLEVSKRRATDKLRETRQRYRNVRNRRKVMFECLITDRRHGTADLVRVDAKKESDIGDLRYRSNNDMIRKHGVRQKICFEVPTR